MGGERGEILMKNERAHGLSNATRLRGEAGDEVRETLRCVSAGLDSAAEGSAVNWGFVTRHRQRGSLKPLCNEKPQRQK